MARSSDLTWRKSSYSGSGACIEIAFAAGGAVLVRDSKATDGPVLEFTLDEWRAFVAGVKAGELDG